MVEKSDEIERMKHVRKFDEQNFDELSYVLFALQGGDTPIYPVLRSSSSVKVLTC